jgi:hypothetical protein
MVLHKVAVEVLLVPGNQRLGLPRYRSRHMRVVIRVQTIDLRNQILIAIGRDAGVCEEFPDCCCDRSRRVRGTTNAA